MRQIPQNVSEFKSLWKATIITPPLDCNTEKIKWLLFLDLSDKSPASELIIF